METLTHHEAPARAERRWAMLVGAIVAMLLAMMCYLLLHWATMPATRMEVVDPLTLHIAGEFTEEQLGSALEPDGSVTLRLLANQYGFTPACVLLPAATAVRIRATSADVVHGFSISRTTVNLMLVPGYIANAQARFPAPAELLMPCHEFCGVGHAGMWAHVRVIERARFMALAAGGKRISCADA